MEGENKESVPEFKEEIVILDKPGVIRGGRPKNPRIIGKKKILGKIGLKGNPPMSLETPQITKETPQISIETPQISIETPQISIEKPQISLETHQISIETPQISLETPQISLETPQISLVTPIKSKQSNAEFLVDSIVKTYWTTKWREQLIIMKFAKTGFNRKRGDFRSFCMKLDHSMKYHQYLNIIKLFDKMDKLPKKEEINHNDLYGKIKLISKGEKSNENKEIKNSNNNIIINNDIENNIKINIDLDLPIMENKEDKKEEIENNISPKSKIQHLLFEICEEALYDNICEINEEEVRQMIENLFKKVSEFFKK
jgi:hypothetical protein